MISLSRILWPTDFSELSIEAGECAGRLHQTFEAELHILHVCTVPVAAPAILDRTTGQLLVGELNLDERPAMQRLRQFVAERFRDDPGVRWHVRSGEVWREVSDFGEEIQADLIVLATRGRTGLRRMLGGSTSELVVRHARCPVLIVKALPCGNTILPGKTQGREMAADVQAMPLGSR